MNNRFKFRTWDKEYEEFAEWTNRDPFFSTSHSQLFFWERVQKQDGSYDGDIVLQDYKDRFVIQQWTGLQDSKGKDIYEGDIIKTDISVATPSEVFFDKGVYKIKIYKDDIPFHIIHGGFKTEIVGNIFENPELLND